MSRLRLSLSAIMLVAVLGCGAATDAVADGPGIRIGTKGKFHPSLLLSSGFDSNVYNIGSNTPVTEKTRSGYLNVRPGVKLLLPDPTVDLYLAGFVNWAYYFASRASALRNDITGRGDFALILGRDSTVSFEIADYFGRSAGDALSASQIIDQEQFYHHTGSTLGSSYLGLLNRARARLGIRPGRGSLKINLNYQFGIARFPGADLDTNKHLISLDVKWKFFPRTAFVADFSFEIIDYMGTMNTDLMPIKGTVGLIGQLTEKTTIILRAGAGSTMTDKNDPANKGKDDWTMFVGDVQFAYAFAPTILIRLGGVSNFQDSGFTNFINYYSVYAEFDMLVGRFALTLRGDVTWFGFGKVVDGGGYSYRESPEDGEVNRKDTEYRGILSARLRTTRWLFVGVDARVVRRDSNLHVFNAQGSRSNFGYMKIEALGILETSF